MTTRSRPIETLPEEQVITLIKAASGRSPSGVRNRALIAVLYYAGLRIGEALALRVRDVDLERGQVEVLRGKGARQRVAALLPAGVPYVERWLRLRGDLDVGPRAPLFCTISRGRNPLVARGMAPGRPLSRPYAHTTLQRLAARVGIEGRVHPHGLRHSHARLLAERGAMMPDVRDQLGHASLATTSRYLDSFAPEGRVRRLRVDPVAP
jgi:site-specific recombinase XerD